MAAKTMAAKQQRELLHTSYLQMNRLADYFAVCGLGDSPELLDGRAPEAERARDIMDMAVVFSNDEAPDGFMTVTMTPSGHKANFDQLQYSTLCRAPNPTCISVIGGATTESMVLL